MLVRGSEESWLFQLFAHPRPELAENRQIILRLIRFQEPHDLLQRYLWEGGTSFHLKIRIVGLQDKGPQAFAIEAPDLGHAKSGEQRHATDRAPGHLNFLNEVRRRVDRRIPSQFASHLTFMADPIAIIRLKPFCQVLPLEGHRAKGRDAYIAFFRQYD